MHVYDPLRCVATKEMLTSKMLCNFIWMEVKGQYKVRKNCQQLKAANAQFEVSVPFLESMSDGY